MLIGSQPQSTTPSASPSWQSWAALCAASFFLAEVNGVTMPFINTYLLEQGWTFGAIGAVASLAGLISFLTNSPAGFLIDRIGKRRLLLACSSLLVGVCIGLLPLFPPKQLAVGSLLAAAAVGKPLFGPLLSALTLGLVGHARLNRAMGINQGWNHAGNIAAAVVAMAIVSWFPVAGVFWAVTAASALAAASVFLIRPGELVHQRLPGVSVEQPARFRDVLRDRRLAVLLGASALFHLANAPVMPLVALKVKYVGGSNEQVAGVVLAAQSVMIPVSLLAGWLGDRWGRRPVLAAGFIALPVRIALYTLTDNPSALVALQLLDGIGAGIFGVTAVVICADLTHGRGHFNACAGLLATAVGLGGVVGPLVSGLIVQHAGFSAAFGSFAVLAAGGAALFIGFMPETRTEPGRLALQWASEGEVPT